MLEAYLVRAVLGVLFLGCLLTILYLRRRKAARLIMVIGVLHMLGAAWVARGQLARIFRDGFFGEADSSMGRLPAQADKELIFWSLLWGGFTFLLGQLVSRAEKEGTPPPAYFGWELAAISLVAALLSPLSGFWLLLLPACMLIRGTGKTRDEKTI
jgi:hypothetical protein